MAVALLRVQKAVEKVDFVLSQSRYALMAYPGIIQAMTVISTAALYADRKFAESQSVIEDICSFLADDPPESRAFPIISRPYTDADIAEAKIPQSFQRETAASLIVGMLADIEAVTGAIAGDLGEAAPALILRRFLGSVERSVPVEIIVETALSLTAERMSGADNPVVVPDVHRKGRSSASSPAAIETVLLQAMSGIDFSSWSKIDYASFASSVIMSMSAALSVDLNRVATELGRRSGPGAASLAIAAGWTNMAGDDVGEVEEVISLTRRLTKMMLEHCQFASDAEKVRHVSHAAALLAPIHPAILARRLRQVAQECNRCSLAEGQVVMLLGEAPAVIV